MRARQRQGGAMLVLMSILIVVLLGFAALALDLGQLFVWRNRLQNAVDSAALSAAYELNGQPGAQQRARLAARNLLQQEAVPLADLPDDAFTFYSAIDPAKLETGSDAVAAFVRVTIADWQMPLLFLPVLNLLPGDAVARVARVNASALAGRSFFMCEYPPVMLCDPFEGSGNSFRDSMSAGDQIQLKQQGGNTWAPGNFAFLEPDAAAGGGAPDVADYLADEGLMGCTPPVVRTKTGGMTNKTASALNTRFDIYDPPAPFGQHSAPRNWPPAPNVIDYPRDQTWRGIDGRFGNGDWDRDGYWTTYHAWQLGHVRPSGFGNWTRWQVYQWEIDNDRLPSKQPLISYNAPPQDGTDDSSYDGIPDPDHLYTGSYPPPRSVPNRRLLYVATLSCNALGLRGGTTATIARPDGFAKIFLTEHVQDPPDATIYGEYVGWADERDANYHADVQLYE